VFSLALSSPAVLAPGAPSRTPVTGIDPAARRNSSVGGAAYGLRAADPAIGVTATAAVSFAGRADQ
jgi:hypothetical protein